MATATMTSTTTNVAAMTIAPKESKPIDWSRPLDPRILQDKVALVTGGSSGIGRQIALALQNAGAIVTIADINDTPTPPLPVPAPVSEQGHAIHLIAVIKTEVADWTSLRDAFKAAAMRTRTKTPGSAWSSSQTVDIVVAAAGIRSEQAKTMHQKLVDPDDPLRGIEYPEPEMNVFATNFVGVYWTAMLAGHYFALSPPAPGKQFLFISSMAAYNQGKSNTISADYVGSKFGVRGTFHQYRRPEMAAKFGGARFNCLVPFYIDTPMIAPEEVKLLERAGWSVGSVKDVEVAAMRCLADAEVRGRAVVVCKGEVREGDRVYDCNDDWDGGFGAKEIMWHWEWCGSAAQQTGHGGVS